MSEWLNKKMSRETVSYTLPTAMPNPFGDHSPDAPPKYTKSKSKGGMMKLNPEWKQWKDSQGGGGGKGVGAGVTTATTTALPVVTNLEDHFALNEATVASGGAQVPLAESTHATIEMLKEPEISLEAGMSAETAMDRIGKILNKYEVPIGLMNKLMLLSEFDILEFIIDDSGSMNNLSDTVNPVTQQPVMRWDEAKERLKEMMEILAHIPFQSALICFLNRPAKITFVRNGRDPSTLHAEMVRQIDAAFATGPAGTTPFLEKLQESFAASRGKSVARWFFGDGIPNGGLPAQEQITSLLSNRPSPSQNPMTFISCTNQDSEVEWMKAAEEVAPYCSEADDFQDEAQEVLRDQGSALPFTKGFHLVCQLVAAMCPDDLDAMDESVPLSKPTLDNLLGIQHTEQSYQYYFDAFLQAQKNRVVRLDKDGQPNVSDEWKKKMNWQNCYADFLQASISKQIPAVQNYLAELKKLEGKEHC